MYKEKKEHLKNALNDKTTNVADSFWLCLFMDGTVVEGASYRLRPLAPA
jgi:hypothetical protein